MSERSAADTNAAERVAQETGLFLRMVRDLRRINSHLASFSYPVLNRQRTALVTSAPLPPSQLPGTEEESG